MRRLGLGARVRTRVRAGVEARVRARVQAGAGVSAPEHGEARGGLALAQCAYLLGRLLQRHGCPRIAPLEAGRLSRVRLGLGLCAMAA